MNLDLGEEKFTLKIYSEIYSEITTVERVLAPVCSILSGGSTTPHMAVMTEPSGFAVAHGWYLAGVYTGLSKIEVIQWCYQSLNFVSVFVYGEIRWAEIANFGGESEFSANNSDRVRFSHGHHS